MMSAARTRATARWAVVLCAVAAWACGRTEAPWAGGGAGGPADAARLLDAADKGDVAGVRGALDAGAPVEGTDRRGRTALIRAAAAGHAAAVGLLAQRGARVDARDYSGQSALMAALARGHGEAARRLLEGGANANDELPPWSALRLAAFTGAEAAVEALLARGADVRAADWTGRDALMYAAGRGHEAVVRRLTAAGARAKAADGRGHTALMFAAGSGHAGVVRALLDAGADARARNRGGEAAAEMAAANGHADVAALLGGGRPPARGDAGGPRVIPAAFGGAPVDGDDGYWHDASARAWAYVQAGYRPETGFVDATSGWSHTTMWDLGSAIAAHYSARELGLLAEAEYVGRMKRTLGTLAALPLYDGVTYDRQYATTAAGAGRRAGWSPTDLGRLFLWLRIVKERDPELAPAAEAAVRRTKTDGVLKDGFLWGRTVTAKGTREFQEGRIGYEQYAAAGFAAWDLPVQNARVLGRYALPMRVLGQPVLADLRGDDRLTSDPLVLLGMEVGWDEDAERLARGVLAAQEERWRRTGRVTIVGEDALAVPPHHFYYYCVYNHGREFAVDVQDHSAVVKGPRWVSAKSAFAWHALLPSGYTRRAVEAVRPAGSRRGWAAGVFEEDGRSTGTESINTQAVILEAALYRRTRKPFLAERGRALAAVRASPGTSEEGP
jgi:ankyrin repeat protein